jgi:hypothetical protein
MWRDYPVLDRVVNPRLPPSANRHLATAGLPSLAKRSITCAMPDAFKRRIERQVIYAELPGPWVEVARDRHDHISERPDRCRARNVAESPPPEKEVERGGSVARGLSAGGGTTCRAQGSPGANVVRGPRVVPETTRWQCHLDVEAVPWRRPRQPECGGPPRPPPRRRARRHDDRCPPSGARLSDRKDNRGAVGRQFGMNCVPCPRLTVTAAVVYEAGTGTHASGQLPTYG